MSRYDDDRDRYRRRSPSPRGRYSDYGRRDSYDRRDDRRDRYRETPPRRDFGNRSFGRDRSPRGTFGDEMRRRDQGRYRDDYRDRRDNRGYGGGRDTDRYGQRRNFGDSGPKHRSQPQRTKFSLLVSNLSSSFSWQDLKDIGRRHGDVSFADCNKVKRGEGILTFHDRESMIRAKEAMDGTDQKGSIVRVDFEFPETADPSWTGDTNNDHPGYYTNKDRSPKRDAGRDRSRSRSRSPPRDRSRSRTRSPSPKREREASASPARDD